MNTMKFDNQRIHRKCGGKQNLPPAVCKFCPYVLTKSTMWSLTVLRNMAVEVSAQGKSKSQLLFGVAINYTFFSLMIFIINNVISQNKYHKV